MCGIAGIVGRSDEALVKRMTDAIAHRGPDSEGFHTGEGVTLGHRRLSIIDLSTGQQPICNEDGTVWIVFNGEIYNYQGLRADLERKGHQFRSQSDTETILHAYEEYGEACVEELYGMFAFAIWDAKRRELFMARDHIGVKPLYYAEIRGALMFGSEIKALLASPEVDRSMDYQAMDDCLTYLYTVPPRTFYKGVRQLPPAHCMTWRDGKYSIRRFWRPNQTPDTEIGEAEWVERLRSVLREVIQGNMIADVPLGAFLSGGLDSSTIVAVMAEHSKNPVKTFTITFDKEGSRYDEAPHAELVSRHFGTAHNVLQATGNAAELLPTMVRHFDEPFGNPTALLVYILSKLIREHVTVALAGDGGDELFLGYARYQGILLSRSYRMIPLPLRRLVAGVVDKCVPESTSGFHLPRRIREFAMGNTLDPVSMYADWISCFSQTERNALYTGDIRREVGDHDSLSHIRELFAECPDDDLASRAAYSDMMSFLPNNVLQYSDRMSMAHALEIRVPFTDPRLIELMARVPRSLKVSPRDTKILMRKSMQGILPDSILARGKIGFNPPMGVWLTTTLQKLMDEYLSEESVRRRGLFDPAVVRQMREDHVRGRRDMTWRLWLLLVMEQWMRG